MNYLPPPTENNYPNYFNGWYESPNAIDLLEKDQQLIEQNSPFKFSEMLAGRQNNLNSVS